ncbi:MAG: hypothetical protein AAF211_10725, partial [Myxococcota bacterium]
MRRVEGPRGEIGMAIKYRSDLVGHPALVDGLTDFVPFLQDPGRSDVSRLLFWDRRQALFVYEIGERVLLADLMERHRDLGHPPGERVAMELLAASANVLDGAAREASTRQLTNHGSLDPWRILVGREGDVTLLGYGLPPVEAFAWMDDEGRPPEVGVAYWPPERIHDKQPEGVHSDIYTMGVIATELATGHPVLDGLSSRDVLATVLDPAGLRSEIQQLGGLTREVRHFLMELVHPDGELRPRSAGEMGIRARQLVSSMSGRALSDVVRGMMGSDLTSESLDQPGFVDDDLADDAPTARHDLLYVSAREAPPPRPDPLWDDEPGPAEATLDMAFDDGEAGLELPELSGWDADDEEPTISGILPVDDDLSEEIPRNPAAQYEISGVFPAVGDVDEVPVDSDRPPQPPSDELLRSELTDPQAQFAQVPWDDDEALYDAPEPSLVDEHELLDDEGPTYELDPEAVSHVVKGMSTTSPTLFPEDIARADADAKRRRDEEIDAFAAAHEADQLRAEELLEELPQVDDEPWDEAPERREPTTMSVEPMGAGPVTTTHDVER